MSFNGERDELLNRERLHTHGGLQMDASYLFLFFFVTDTSKDGGFFFKMVSSLERFHLGLNTPLRGSRYS